MFVEYIMIDGEPAKVIEIEDKYALAESARNFYILLEGSDGKHYVAVKLSKREYTLPDALKEFYDFVRV
ncbi:hypothetical protein [Thermococcus sp. 21S7]|uniref:hypothetical protein n=1 Tax=Thermococcus sp. 21S7 TaxID=1638221 RepID=UPI00143B274F|nr:hypothetical protein [Thermococcus sp. 21S7]NJE60444.1 hypothetical protein [Thermococcus sp. 21S7]